MGNPQPTWKEQLKALSKTCHRCGEAPVVCAIGPTPVGYESVCEACYEDWRDEYDAQARAAVVAALASIDSRKDT